MTYGRLRKRLKEKVGGSDNVSLFSDENNAIPHERDQELVERLEDASDQIEALLYERDNLLNLCNQLKSELNVSRTNLPMKNNGSSTSDQDRLIGQRDDHARDQAIMEMILNDHSTSHSCDDDSQQSIGTFSAAYVAGLGLSCVAPPKNVCSAFIAVSYLKNVPNFMLKLQEFY